MINVTVESIKKEKTVEAVMETAPILIDLSVITRSGSAEKYTGSYNVIPAVESQTLITKEKIMTDNVVVEGVPSYEVSNESGGTTFYICGEV